MKNLIEQIRERFSGQEYVEQPEIARERRIPLRKTVSFKEGSTQERKRHQNWFRRQFSRKMSLDNDANGEQVIAVAAAAFVIASLEGSTIPKQKQVSEGPETSSTQLKSKKETKKGEGEGSTRSRESSDGKVPGTAVADEITIKVSGPAPAIKRTLSDKGPAPSIKNTPSFTEKVPPAPSPKRTPTFKEKPALSMEKVPTFAEEQLKNDRKIEAVKPKTSGKTARTETASQKPDLPTTTRPTVAPTKAQTLSRPGHEGTKADAWEKVELAKIKTRFEELIARILSWENKKRAKARRRLERTESEMERTRIRALERFRSEMEDINQIAEGARDKAAETQRHEELKAKEKANTIREIGKIPKTCFCF